MAAATVLLLELLVVVAAFLDLRTRRIPNWLTVPGVVAGLSVNGYFSGWKGLETGLLGMLLAFVVYSLLFAIRALSGGDVKLMAAVGAFVGPREWPWIFAITVMVWLGFAVITLTARGGWKQTLSNVGAILGSFARLRLPHWDRPDLDVGNPGARTLPHGAAIAVGVLIWTVWGGR